MSMNSAQLIQVPYLYEAQTELSFEEMTRTGLHAGCRPIPVQLPVVLPDL